MNTSHEHIPVLEVDFSVLNSFIHVSVLKNFLEHQLNSSPAKFQADLSLVHAETLQCLPLHFPSMICASACLLFLQAFEPEVDRFLERDQLLHS